MGAKTGTSTQGGDTHRAPEMPSEYAENPRESTRNPLKWPANQSPGATNVPQVAVPPIRRYPGANPSPEQPERSRLPADSAMPRRGFAVRTARRKRQPGRALAWFSLWSGSGCGTICRRTAQTRHATRSVGAAGAQVPYKHKVTSSNLVPTTRCNRPASQPAVSYRDASHGAV